MILMLKSSGEYRNAKTVITTDVIFALKRLGRPIYGFDADT